jgi:hypothetical protein
MMYVPTRELSRLESVHVPDGPWVVVVHGIGGIGKSSLLSAFVENSRRSELAVASLDCASIEPTERGFLAWFCALAGHPEQNVEQLARSLELPRSPLVLALDHYEAFRLLDAWLRNVFVPAFSGRVRIVVASREAPLLQWSTDPVLGPHFSSLRMETLEKSEAAELLERAGVPEGARSSILRLADGHPLALRLAAAASASVSSGHLDEMPLDRVLHELTRYYLAEISEPGLRKAVEAASTVRRASEPLLAAMLGTKDAARVYEQLGELHFVEPRRDGLALHDAVKGFVSSELQSRDPVRFADYQRSAWRQMRREVRNAPVSQLWRYTADLIYLIQNPVVREAFFPSGEPAYAVEPARREDFDAVLEISARHEPSAATELTRFWLERAPHTFFVARGSDAKVAGYYCSLDSRQVEREDVMHDPITRAWWEDLEGAGRHQALFLRRWLSLEHGEAPSPVQAACWLDLKRSYLELRPHLRRVYLTLEDLAPYLPVALRLGFAPVPDATVTLGESTYSSAMLDFGPRSVNGWMQRLFTKELGATDPCIDLDARQVIGPSGREDLSPLEFGVVALLIENEGDPVSRKQLLAEVWDVHHEGSSNVVDTVVAGLRRKLGDGAGRVESVRGVGYRYQAPGSGPE